MTQGKVWEVLDTLAAAQAENGDYAAAVKTSEQAIDARRATPRSTAASATG